MEINNNNNLDNIKNGWEYFTEINPNNLSGVQQLQNVYLHNYNLAYHKFINSLCIEKENLDSIINDLKYTIDKTTHKPITKYRFIIDIHDDNDIINNDNNYPIKFLKSKFILFKSKKLKNDLINYYKPLGFYIKGPYELINNKNIRKYYIELCWN